MASNRSEVVMSAGTRRSVSAMQQDAVDQRPRTAVMHHFAGMGDLVWHVPYFRAIAAQSRGGRVSVIASASTFAGDLIGHEPWVEQIIDFDRRPRTSERRRGKHSGIRGLFVMAAELRAFAFDRVVLFTHHANRGLMLRLASIPQRIGFGSTLLQRAFLTSGPYIRFYRGASVAVYKEATAFSLAHGFVKEPMVPKLNLRPDALLRMQSALQTLPRPLYAFAIGTSEPFKQWGGDRFSALARVLLDRGMGVLLLGGPREAALAGAIEADIPGPLRGGFHKVTNGTVADSAAALAVADACIGNDTGIANMAAAVDRPSYVLLGPRPLLDHDPLMRLLCAPELTAITVADVMHRLETDGAPGFGLQGNQRAKTRGSEIR